MLTQYHGNDMDALAARLCTLLRESTARLLEPVPILVPNLGIARWLETRVAGSLGIAANLDFVLPRRFVTGLAAATTGAQQGSADAYDKERLALRLMRLVPQVLNAPHYSPLKDYLAQSSEQRRLFALCRRVAALFDQYLLYRPEWLLDWEAGGTAPARAAELWQPALWRSVVADIRGADVNAEHGAARQARLLAVLRQTPPDSSLPTQVFGFGLGSLAPFLLEVLNELGRASEVHLLQFNPCCEYWGEIVDERLLARWRTSRSSRAQFAEVGNPLLAAWGRLGRENLELLLEKSSGDFADEFLVPAGEGVLASVQRDILELTTPASSRALAVDDESLQFAETHSEMRELEVLHDHLLNLFETLPALKPRDVVVMAPDIARYAPAITAVFAEARDTERFIPFTIADRAPSEDNTLVRSFLHLLELPVSRFRASEVGALLAVPAVTERFGLDPDEVAILLGWIRDSGIRWGLGRDGAADSLPRLERNTWDFGLARMLFGVALGRGTLCENVLPLELGGADAAERIGKLAWFIDTLAHYARAMQQARPVTDWLPLLNRLLADVYAEGPRYDADVTLLQRALRAVAADFVHAEYTAPIERAVLVEALANKLSERGGSHNFLAGGVNFCQLAPLRCIPFRVVCLLGMNASDFPRRAEPPGYDLMARQRRRGDPSRRDDDRYLFLEAVLAARDQLYVSRIARDERTDSPREPALPVIELCAYVDRYWTSGHGDESASQRLTRRHRLKAAHADYFRPRGPLFSYRAEWLPALPAARSAGGFCDTPLARQVVESVQFATLQEFFRNPCRAFFAERLGLLLFGPDAVAVDEERFVDDALLGYRLRQELAAQGRSVTGLERTTAAWLHGGELPHGAQAQRLIDSAASEVRALQEQVEQWRELEVSALAVDLELAGVRLTGSLGGIRDGRIRLIEVAKEIRGHHLISFWITHLVASAQRALAGPSELYGLRVRHQLAALDAAAAESALRALLDVFCAGLCRPLPLFAKASFAWASAHAAGSSDDQAMEKARTVFLGAYTGPAECEEVHIRRAWPDPEAALNDEFRACATQVFLPLCAALEKLPI